MSAIVKMSGNSNESDDSEMLLIAAECILHTSHSALFHFLQCLMQASSYYSVFICDIKFLREPKSVLISAQHLNVSSSCSLHVESEQKCRCFSKKLWKILISWIMAPLLALAPLQFIALLNESLKSWALKGEKLCEKPSRFPLDMQRVEKFIN